MYESATVDRAGPRHSLTLCQLVSGHRPGARRPFVDETYLYSWKYGVRLILYDSSRRGRGPLAQKQGLPNAAISRIERIMCAVLKTHPSPF